MSLLTIEDVSAGYGRSTVLHGVSLGVETGEFVVVLGSNGAGKSTLMQAVMGLLPLTGGSLRLRDVDLGALPVHARVRHRVAYVPEGRRVFPALTVEENLVTAWRPSGRAQADSLDLQYATFERLRERRNQLAGTLSGGEQQMLALARALISEPELLVADEISLGLAPMVVEELFEVFAQLNRAGTAILLAEQSALLALEYATTAYVMETGRITLSGAAADLADDPRVADAYLRMS
ncbi:ABC transporter ATP-binding protein [Nocardioides sp. QY071]|jgi:branched-chain amino acid transport system ATP-binding protein|uniref:ABC transporter ATP-binding protein n=1 Tax=Nocardioides sp. QY071 TaxID=3044187 RepID=UPI00249AC83E|nr:ABC transporter ATP-binding protein [Nocardioides sp. QY071]WGY01346.1 ABC transporter ATP-binding protein [Nocardioides sp. QY071]